MSTLRKTLKATLRKTPKSTLRKCVIQSLSLTNFVKEVYAGNVHPVAFNHIYEVVSSGIIFEHDVSIVDAVLSKDGLWKGSIVSSFKLPLWSPVVE